jgi:Rho GTPase-activating protein 1
LPQPILDHDETVRLSSTSRFQFNAPAQPPAQQFRPTQQFDVPLSFILDHNPNSDLPPIVTDLLDFLREYGLEVEGIFRRSAEIATIRTLQARINKGKIIGILGKLINFLKNSNM